MSKFSIILFSLMPFVVASAAATSKLARLCSYDPLLGPPISVPFCILGGVYYYWPWKWFEWYFKFNPFIPSLFSDTKIYFFFAIIAFMIIIFIFRSKPQLTSHGSAHWAEYGDLKKMGLISGSGVIVGLYDSPNKRRITSILRNLETAKNEKLAYAELAYDEKNAKNDVYDARPYNAKKDNPFTVYPYVWLYKRFFDFYVTLSHFYLRDNSNTHITVVAPTRSGKGVGLIIPTLLGSWKESCVINDIKSENWGITAGWRKKMGQKVIKFEPTAADGSSARWNPLDEIPIGTPDEVSAAQNLAAIIADFEGKGKPDHWTANAANVIMAVILHLKYAHLSDPENYPTSPNLYTVAAFMKANMVEEEKITYEYERDKEGKVKTTSTGTPIKARDEDGNYVILKTETVVDAKGFIDTLNAITDNEFQHVPDEGINIRKWDKTSKQYVYQHFTPEDMAIIYPTAASLELCPNTHPIIYQAFIEITSKAPNELASIISTANTALKEYLDPILSRNTATSDFCVDDLMNYDKPVSLYLVTPPSDLLRLSPIFRLFFEFMIKTHARDIGTFSGGQSKVIYKHKCLLLMDEFASLGNLQNFASSLAYIAGYGLKAFLICQGLPQINAIYGKDNQIIMNTHLNIYYAPNDNDTAKYIENLLGNKTEEVVSTQIDSSSILGKRTRTYSEIARPLMTSDEIKRMPDQEIISLSNHPPILTDKVKYYENNYFRKRLVDAPVVSDVIRNDPYPERDALVKSKKKVKNIALDWKFEESKGNLPKPQTTNSSNIGFEYKNYN